MFISSWGLADSYTSAVCAALILLSRSDFVSSLQPRELRKKGEPLSLIIPKTGKQFLI